MALVHLWKKTESGQLVTVQVRLWLFSPCALLILCHLLAHPYSCHFLGLLKKMGSSTEPAGLTGDFPLLTVPAAYSSLLPSLK